MRSRKKEKNFFHWKIRYRGNWNCLNLSSTKPIFNETCSKFNSLKMSSWTRHFFACILRIEYQVCSNKFSNSMFSKTLSFFFLSPFFFHFLVGCTSSCGPPCMRVLSTRINLRTVTLSIDSLCFAWRTSRWRENWRRSSTMGITRDWIVRV